MGKSNKNPNLFLGNVMKKNKAFIIIVVILIVLIIAQLIYFNSKRKNENKIIIAEHTQNSTNNTEAAKVLNEKIYPLYTGDLYADHNIYIDEDEFASEVYKLVFENLNTINENISSLSWQEIKAYYINNKKQINSMNIYSDEDLYLIAKQVKNALSEDTVYYNYSNILTDTIKDNENGYCTFDLNIIFINGQSVNLKISLANSENAEHKIIVEDNSEINQLYEAANKGFSRANAIQIIENIMNNAKILETTTLTYSINRERQYFDLHQEEMNKLGIYSMDDFVTFIGALKSISWNSKDTITGYTIELTNATQNGRYITVPLYINYGNIERIKLNLNVSTSETMVPQIKIS